MKAPSKCPMCGEKRKWIMVDKSKKINGTGAVGGMAAGAKLGGLPGAVVGGVIGSALGRSKKVGEFHCAKCGFAHVYDL